MAESPFGLRDRQALCEARMPPTRYQGSKRKLVDWIWEHVRDLRFHTVLDAFGGTAAVSHLFKRQGKAVTYNDILRFNHVVGTALIENAGVTLDAAEIDRIVRRHRDRSYPAFVERTFAGIYYPDHENRWLDTARENIRHLSCRLRRAIALYALGQAALAKRPYNLFHRRNLYLRTADVRRGFGNKTTWDRPFEEHFRRYAEEANAAVFDNGQRCQAWNLDAAAVKPGFDLVYIDPPYVNARGVGVDYHAFYHFLEGLVDYEQWGDRIDWSSKHRRLIPQPGRWTRPPEIHEAFRTLFERFASSILVVSYRADGIPSPTELADGLRSVKRRVQVHYHRGHKYVLSTNRRAAEILLVGTDD